MKNPKKIRKSDIVPYILSFIIPAVIMGIAFFSLGIYPGGKMTLLTYDLKALFLALYGYIAEPGAGYDNILHSMSGALGGNYYSTFVLCISPTDIIFKFVPVRYIPEALYFIVLTKVGLCGFACSVFLKKNHKFALPVHMVVVLACCYALMSYNFMYYMAPMWYDAIILLPLIALSLEKIVSGQKSFAFIALMSLCIICDYYIAFMSIIALIIYVMFRLAEEKPGFKEYIRRFMSFALHGVLSAGISMFVLLPSVLDFERGKLSEGLSNEGNIIKNTFLDVILSFKPQSYAGVDFNASPNVFCGSLVTFLVVFWLLSGRKELRTRIAALIVIIFYFLSFMFGPLDRAWHGFREPVCFSVRYAYTFVFFMICFSARGYSRLSELKIASSSMFGLFRFLFISYTLVEVLLNGSYILAGIGTECGYSLASEYKKMCDVQDHLVPYDELSDPESYGRVVSDYKYSNFDGSLFGYDGLSRFCSSYNFKTHMFFRSMGLNSIYHSLGEKGMTPPLASLFGARYILSYWVDLSELYDPVKKFDVYTRYENSFALPLAYEVNSSCKDSDSDLSDDPFDNLNRVYSELFAESGEEIKIFDHMQVNRLSDDLEYNFVTTEPGRYYMYVEYKYDDEDSLDEYEGDWEFMHKMIVRNYVFDETNIGDYGNNQFSYCVDLGTLEGNREYYLTLESSATEDGAVYICYFDEAAYEQVMSSVNGAKLIDIGKKGIVMEASVNGDSELLMTLPYEKGYTVYVDGEKTQYGSYRDCIMLIPLKDGNHEIVIKYFPPGLKTGVLLSILSLGCGMLLLKKRTNYSFDS